MEGAAPAPSRTPPIALVPFKERDKQSRHGRSALSLTPHGAEACCPKGDFVAWPIHASRANEWLCGIWWFLR